MRRRGGCRAGNRRHTAGRGLRHLYIRLDRPTERGRDRTSSVTNLVLRRIENLRRAGSDRVYQDFPWPLMLRSRKSGWLCLPGRLWSSAPAKCNMPGRPCRDCCASRGYGLVVRSTLLAMMEDDVPSLRLLILGGEQCPQNLVERWCRPGRRMVNTYGPTEATVIATYADCAPGKPVTIGRPVPNYHAYILDDNLASGGGRQQRRTLLGRHRPRAGYVGLPEVTRAKFVANPFTSHGGYPLATLQDGRSGSLHARPAKSNSWPGRFASQAPRLSHRTVGNRERAAGMSGRVGRSRNAAHRQPSHRAVGGLPCAGAGATLNEDSIRRPLAHCGCRFSWCRPCWKRSKCCRRWPAAKSTARRCPRLARRRQNELARASLPATNLRPRSPRFGNRCSRRR